MRILMLGWEFPPFIAGGLGTACYGLTKALDRLGHQVIFVLPKPVDRAKASHIRLLSPDGPIPSAAPSPHPDSSAVAGDGAPSGAARSPRLRRARMDAASPSEQFAAREGEPEFDAVDDDFSAPYAIPGFEHTLFRAVPSAISSPYPAFAPKPKSWYELTPSDVDGAVPDDDSPIHLGPVTPEEAASLRAAGIHPGSLDADILSGGGGDHSGPHAGSPPAAGFSNGPGAGYDGDMVQASQRYARLVLALAKRERFDVIHAHDWMTYPAGQAVAQLTGKPLVAHVHSTEFDRAGEHPNQRVYDIERRGMHAALRVIAVSNLTATICASRYGVAPSKIDVVWNGIDSEAAQPRNDNPGIGVKDKIVLFLGRITMQKGPEYFIRAAKRVLEKVPNAKFVVAGSGDMATRMIEEAAALGIGSKVMFTGFLRGNDVDRVFRMADCYVMPSVSEPFGIAPLEAMRNDVPVIISKQSGVSEALTHALKVDFWDVDEMANKIVAVLRHPPLGATLREHGAFELRKLTWEGAAMKCVESYGRAVSTLARI